MRTKGLLILVAVAVMVLGLIVVEQPTGSAIADTPTPPPLAIQNPDAKLYVLANVADVPTSAKIALETAGQLTGVITKKPLAMPGMQISDYSLACLTAPPQPDAIIVLAPSISNGQFNYLVGVRNWTEVRFQAILVRCIVSPSAPGVALDKVTATPTPAGTLAKEFVTMEKASVHPSEKTRVTKEYLPQSGTPASGQATIIWQSTKVHDGEGSQNNFTC